MWTFAAGAGQPGPDEPDDDDVGGHRFRSSVTSPRSGAGGRRNRRLRVFVPAGETSAQAAIAAWTQAQAPRVPDPAERALQIKAECRRRIPAVCQHVLDKVKPETRSNRVRAVGDQTCVLQIPPPTVWHRRRASRRRCASRALPGSSAPRRRCESASIYAEGVAWVMAMRAHCAALIADPGLAPAWPEPSDAVRILAAAY